jgi:predicted ATPase/DNA-binding winged helix-turn-helix (wHTH) protein
MEREKRVRVGSRALEILFALAERAGEIVGKDELIARVWPNIFVEEVTLRVHIAALRKVLRDRRGGKQYVENVAGRGYRLAASVTCCEAEVSLRIWPATGTDRRGNLPSALAQITGRSQVIDTLIARLARERFVTIVGPGGIGKTALALAMADKLLESYEHGACFVDLAALANPHLVPNKLASLLGLAMGSENSMPSLLAFLANRQMLIVLDNCEHVIDAAAMLGETVLGAASRVYILATSREPLRSRGETVHRLSALEVPPPSAKLTAAEAQEFSAVQLFVERAMASAETFEFGDADAPAVVDLCRRLDGLPLAIELMAARVDRLGLRDLTASIDNDGQVVQASHRVTLPRQQSLRATIDWSYHLLSQAEQLTLHRVAVFAGGFDLAAASAIVSDSNVTTAEVIDSILSLGEKSLLTVDLTGEDVVYRLLYTTRAYALEKLRDSGEQAEISRRHASYLCTIGERTAVQGHAEWLATYGHMIDDIRAAFDWCFSSEGDRSVGTALAVASAPLWFGVAMRRLSAKRG